MACFPNRYSLTARWILEGLIVHESGRKDGFGVIQSFSYKMVSPTVRLTSERKDGMNHREKNSGTDGSLGQPIKAVCAILD